MKRLLSQIVSAIGGLWLATLLPLGVVIRAYPGSNFFGFPITAQWQMIVVLGIALGCVYYFVRPLLKTLSLPLEIITLGFFTIIIDGGLLWVVDKIFDELHVPIWLPLLYTTLIIWIINIVLQKFLIHNEY